MPLVVENDEKKECGTKEKFSEYFFFFAKVTVWIWMWGGKKILYPKVNDLNLE